MNTDARQSTAMTMCQMLLKQKQSERGTPLNGEDIASAVEQVVGMLGYAEIDKQALVKALEERFTVYAPDHRTLGSDDNHVAWFPARRGAITWRYWDRYRIYLDERMPPSGVASVDRVTDDVLQRLEDPQRPEMWDRRGLVMGHVQSGKTANYCGLICKAADAGYKVIIVLSGIHNSLRSQTQMRLDEGFLGFMSEPSAGRNQAFRPAGVGAIDASIVANTATNRTERGDFSRTVANQFGIHPGGMPLLFVTKKNVSVLRNLNNWIASCTNAEDPETQRRFIRDVPVLVIDDEADLASIDTRLQEIDENGNPDPEHDPTETNRQIRRLLRAFEKVAYVGYTATPFANIYIYDRGFTTQLGDDLFPRSFIISIPPPTNYMGPARIFGVSEDEDAGLEEVNPLPVVRIVSDHAETQSVAEARGWMPPRLTERTQHDPRYQGTAHIPPSLREALFAFVLATVTRTIRRCQPFHNTMLIHVVRYTKVQERVAVQVESALKEIVQRLRNGDGSRRPTIIEEFRELWIRDFETTSSQSSEILKDELLLPPWAEVEAKLLSIASSIRMKIINGTAGDVLDYEDHKETGMNVIVIGGDKLSRGLTLEGLSVSYFLRASRMYDTLMQMGRWFGYREHYSDLCRLYTTAELLEWFTHITAASEELQHEFEHMVKVRGTPKDYGLKVRSHPALLVTSAVKMRHGTEMRLSFSGDISETIIFRRDPDWVARNFNTATAWLRSLPEPQPPDTRDGGYTWCGVPATAILDFLNTYNSHEDARRADTDLLSKYVRAQNANGELIEWTVHLVSSHLQDAVVWIINGRSIGLVTRSPFPQLDEQQQDRYAIRRLVNPTDEMIDLSPEQKAEALRLTLERWQTDPTGSRGEEAPNRPGGREIRQVRPKSRGLLLLYPINPLSNAFAPGTKPIVGMAISFPKSDTAREVTYTVNNVFTRQGGDDDSL
jgi:hypothetical protein